MVDDTGIDGRGLPSRFSSDAERRLWLWALLVVVTIFSTLGLAGSFAGALGESGLDSITFVLGAVLVVASAIAYGLGQSPNQAEVAVAMGVGAVYVLVLTRLTTGAERSHLIEYGIVALLIYAALAERKGNGRRVPAIGALAIALASSVGLIDELIQLFVPGRVFDPIDIVFNAGAATMAVGAASGLAWARRRRSAGEGFPGK